MSVVYSTRFLAWAASELPTPYTVPDGYVVIVRDIDVWSGGGEMTNWQVSSDGIAKFAAGQFTIESIAQTAQWRGRQVLYGGEILEFQSDGPTDGMISGYLLVDDNPTG